jgi:AcrR family transcriptional regulator
VTKPALYYHFGSKEGLASALLEEFRQVAEEVRERAFARARTPQELFVSHAREMLELGRRYRDSLVFGLSLWFGCHSLKELIQHSEHQEGCNGRDWQAGLVRLGLTPEAAALATRSYWSLLLRELMELASGTRQPEDVDRISGDIARVLTNGVPGVGLAKHKRTDETPGTTR